MNIPGLEKAYGDIRSSRGADNLCPSCGRLHRTGQGEDPCQGKRLAIIDCIGPHFRSGMHREIASGLSRPRKSIPSTYLYDAQGSRLFDEICTLPEYYPTRTELEILRVHAESIMDFFDARGGDLIEIGSGSDLKVRRLLDAVPSSALGKIRYVPMDISRTGLVHSSLRILRDYDDLHICVIIGDFTRHLDRLPGGRKLITFFGGTFGNFSDSRGINLLKSMARVMGNEDRLLMGIDMLKDVGIIEAAYNDSCGVTARFNLNVLSHVNQGLGAGFCLHDFEHVAFFNPDREQIEMHLRARRDVRTVLHRIGLAVHIAEGETIRTEISRKFSREKAEDLFRRAGLCPAEWYTDPLQWFSLVSLRKDSG